MFHLIKYIENNSVSSTMFLKLTIIVVEFILGHPVHYWWVKVRVLLTSNQEKEPDCCLKTWCSCPEMSWFLPEYWYLENLSLLGSKTYAASIEFTFTLWVLCHFKIPSWSSQHHDALPAVTLTVKFSKWCQGPWGSRTNIFIPTNAVKLNGGGGGGREASVEYSLSRPKHNSFILVGYYWQASKKE